MLVFKHIQIRYIKYSKRRELKSFGPLAHFPFLIFKSWVCLGPLISCCMSWIEIGPLDCCIHWTYISVYAVIFPAYGL